LKYLLFHLWKELVCFNRIPSFTLFCSEREVRQKWEREGAEGKKKEEKKQALAHPDPLKN